MSKVPLSCGSSSYRGSAPGMGGNGSCIIDGALPAPEIFRGFSFISWLFLESDLFEPFEPFLISLGGECGFGIGVELGFELLWWSMIIEGLVS